MTKICKRCGVEKHLTDYYKHTQMLDGHLSFCKDCTKERVSNHRDKNLDKVRAYDRSRQDLPHRIAARKAYQETRTTPNLSPAAWSQRHPNKRKAQIAVGNAVRDGRLKKLPCEVCGDPNSQGHHEDYDKILEVVWLCRTHHGARHRELNELRRAA